MPLLRVNATTQGLTLHGSAQPAKAVLARASSGKGAVTIMVHGYRYSPFIPKHCPHSKILHADAWPSALGSNHPSSLGIAFAWHGRGGLRQAYSNTIEQAQGLATLIAHFRRRRPVHLIAHSLGATLVLAALPYLQSGDVGRIVLLSGAAHLGLAHHALSSPAGQTCELFHITSRENALFDHAFEQIIPDTGAIARGLQCRQALRIQIDCSKTLFALKGLGYPVAPPLRRICHWSSYTRPGAMALNAALLNGDLPLPLLQNAIPLFSQDHDQAKPLATPRNNRIIKWHNRGKGLPNEHAY